MAEYVPFDSNVEVLGQTMISVLDAMGIDGNATLIKHGLPDIKADGWYSQERYLAAYKEIAEDNSMNMVAIGMKVPDMVPWPPNVQTVEDALKGLNIAYEMNHRGGNFGSYQVDFQENRNAVVTCHNPYPSDFDYGLIYRIVQKFRPDDSSDMGVERDDSIPNRKNGDGDTCIYNIYW